MSRAYGSNARHVAIPKEPPIFMFQRRMESRLWNAAPRGASVFALGAP